MHTVVIQIEIDPEALETLKREFEKLMEPMDYSIASLNNKGILKAVHHYHNIIEEFRKLDENRLFWALEQDPTYDEVDLRKLLNALHDTDIHDVYLHADKEEDEDE